MKIKLSEDVEVCLDSRNLDYKVHNVTIGDVIFDIMEWNKMYYNKFVRQPFYSIEKAALQAKGYVDGI